jgi:ADP-heptose:LPS heptosyltransferase
VKILVLRFSSIGDIVLTSPVLRCLKEQIPNSEVHFLTKKKFSGLLEHNPHITKILTFEKAMGNVIKELQNENYDLVLDLHHNIRTFIIKFRLGKPSFSFDKLNWQKWVLVNLKKDFLPDNHVVDRYLKAAKPIGIADDGKGLEFFPCDCDSIDENSIPKEMRQLPFVVLSIGGTHFTKKMPVEKWAELARLIPIPMVIIGGKEDIEEGRILENLIRKFGQKVWNTCGLFNIGGSAHLIRKSVLVVSHDTGMMHIAAAFQKPIIAIWGNTSPRFGMFPFRTSYINLEVSELGCRPCSKIGFSHCPESHFKCMNLQSFTSPNLNNFIRYFLNRMK